MKPRAAALVFLLPVLTTGAAFALPIPDGAGLSVVRKECTRCHSLMKIANCDGKTRAGWVKHVERMTDIERRPEAMKAVVDYLTEHFPPD